MMPVLFVGHGSPMNAVEDTRFSRTWRSIADSIERPSAILCVSAHWETPDVAVTAMDRPKTIHDFYGFPEELNAKMYPAHGSPALARRVVDCLAPVEHVRFDTDWGLDHGTWSVLCRMYPDADIPVVQLSLDRTKTPSRHAALARHLAPLRREGVLVLGSGNIVHNLGLIDWNGGAYEWARKFDGSVSEALIAGDSDRLVGYGDIPGAAESVPTNEHYLPLLYADALRESGDRVKFFAEGIVLGSLSMRSVLWY